jgi:hypothetical protein
MTNLIQTIVVIAGLFSLAATAQNKQISSGNKIEPLPRDLPFSMLLI